MKNFATLAVFALLLAVAPMAYGALDAQLPNHRNGFRGYL